MMDEMTDSDDQADHESECRTGDPADVKKNIM